MSTNIYLAAPFRKRFALQGIRADLLRGGFTVVSRWLDLKEENEADAFQCAHVDIEDIKLSDTLISFPDPARAHASRGGHFFEEGFAYGLGKRVIVVEHRTHIFHNLCEFFPTWPQCFSALTRPLRMAA
jgi:nucleoside 2-deoxyribosyltransferase